MALRSVLVMLVAALAVIGAALRGPDLHVVLAHASAAVRDHREHPRADHSVAPVVELTKASTPRGERDASPSLDRVALRTFATQAPAAFEPLPSPLRAVEPPARQRARLMVFLN